MRDMIRHIGKMKNTGAKCIVVFRKIPANVAAGEAEDNNHALVVETDALPDMYQDNIHQVIRSEEAQQTPDLYTVLHRRTFTDGGNMLLTLHQRGMLRKVSVDDIALTPLPSHTLDLRFVNNTIDHVESRYDPNEKKDTTTTIKPEEESVLTRAQNILARAALMEEEAKRLREEAYALAPETRPFQGKTKLSPEERQRRQAESNVKRRKDFNDSNTQ